MNNAIPRFLQNFYLSAWTIFRFFENEPHLKPVTSHDQKH
jgi:hypothetical protein